MSEKKYEHQLVLQFPPDCLRPSFELEGIIATAVGNLRHDPMKPHAVDGYSEGDGSIEIFILTNNPPAAFELTKPHLAAAGLIEMVTARHRRLTEEKYEVMRRREAPVEPTGAASGRLDIGTEAGAIEPEK
jgi:hypothetical protein